MQRALRGLSDDDLMAALRWTRLRADAIQQAVAMSDAMGPSGPTGLEGLSNEELLAGIDEAADAVVEAKLAEQRQQGTMLPIVNTEDPA